MTKTTLMYGAILIVVILVFFFKSKLHGGLLPPHEFAYGATFSDITNLPDKVRQFLSLEAIDPQKIEIETYVGSTSAKNLKPLIDYAAAQKNPALNTLIASLNKMDTMSNKTEKAIRLIEALLPFKDILKNESQQDSVMVFIYYGLKEPSNLAPLTKTGITDLVRQLDTQKQSEEFLSGNCPKNYLVGNVNIYPLNLENTFWHERVDFGPSKNSPILEIRFMGLRGIFKYLLNEYEAKTGAAFKHVDGEQI
jgi:hypothetical protein